MQPGANRAESHDDGDDGSVVGSATADPSVAMIIVLALLTALVPVASLSYAPALPTMARDLRVDVPAMQSALAVLMAAMGVSYPFAGTASDTFGRRVVIFSALAVLVGASLGATATQSLAVLKLCAALQGTCAAVSTVTAQAHIRDAFPALAQRQRVLARMTATRALCVIFTPWLSTWCVHALGWRGSMGMLAAMGALTAGVAAWVLDFAPARRAPAAAPPQKAAPAAAASSAPVPKRGLGGVRAGARAWCAALSRALALLADPRYASFLCADCGGFATFYAYVSMGGHVLQGWYGVELRQSGLLLGLLGLGLMAGTMASPRVGAMAEGPLSGRAGTLRLGLLLGTCALALLLLGLELLGDAPRARRAGCALLECAMVVVTFARGLAVVQTLSLCLQRFPEEAGTAAGLLLSARMLCSSLAVALVGHLPAWTGQAAMGEPRLLVSALLGVHALGWAGYELLSDARGAHPDCCARPSYGELAG